jgi:hypothetical protein
MDIHKARKVVVLSILVGAAIGIVAIIIDHASRITTPTDSTHKKALDAGTALSPEEEMAALLEWRKQYRAFHGSNGQPCLRRESGGQRGDDEEFETPPPVFAATGPDPRKTVAMDSDAAILPIEESPRKKAPQLSSNFAHNQRRPLTDSLHLIAAKLNHTKLTARPEIMWDTVVPALPLANLRPRLNTAVSALNISNGPPAKSKSANALSALSADKPPPPVAYLVMGSPIPTLHHRRTAQQPTAHQPTVLLASPMPSFLWNTAEVDVGDGFGFFEVSDDGDDGDDAREGMPVKGGGGSWCALEAADPWSAQTAYRQAYRAHRTEALRGPLARGGSGCERVGSASPERPFARPRSAPDSDSI